jgi:MipA family protein
MKNYIALNLLIAMLGATTAPVHATTASKRVVVQLGTLAMGESSLYEGVSTENNLFPLLLVDYGRFYFRGTEGGYRFLTRGSTSVALQIGLNNDGYTAGDSEAMEGMRSRRHTVESGLAVSHRMKPGRIELRLMHDVGSTHHGHSARVSYEHRPMITAAGATSLLLAGDYYDASKSDYYFGVLEHEATPDRPARRQGALFALSASIRQAFPISHRITLLGSLSYRTFDRDIKRSPIVGRKGQIQTQAAILYRF